MASSEAINVEFDTGGRGAERPAPSASGGGGGSDRSPWESVKYHLDPGNHTLMENVLASLVFVLFILTIALAATHGGGGGGGGGAATCQDQLCLLRSASIIDYANLSASPCEDFYTYACGLALYPLRISPLLQERTVLGELKRENDDKLEAILRSPVVRDNPASYERKLKTFFVKCNDDFLIERIRGAPVATYLRPDLYLLNSSTVARFDLNEMLLKTYMIYGADAFFEYILVHNFLDDDKNTISINPGGIGMPTSSYLSSTNVKHREAYKTYIGTVAQLLVSDADPDTVETGAESRITEFVDDVLEIETELAKISDTSTGPDPNKPPLDPSNMPTLTQMDYKYPPISWSRFFGESFRPNAPDTTRVAVQDPDYVQRMAEYIGQRLVSLYPGLLYKRKLSNYMNWRILQRYTGDLSSSYVHARREFGAALSTGAYVYESRFDYCYRRARHFMGRGVSALFVSDHFTDSSKVAIDNIYRVLQSELVSAVDRLGWVDAAAREKSKAKVRAITDRIGYSQAAIEDKYLDEHYETLNADKDDYLLDMTVSWQNFHRENQGARLGKQPDTSDWEGATYDTNLYLNNPDMHITVPAGILQWPYYTAGLPAYINYATIGQPIAAELIKSIDATGQLFDKDGKMNPMWATETILNYVQRASCINQTFSAMRAGPYVTPSGSQYVNIDTLISRHLRNVIAGADGLRLALRAYQGRLGESEAPLPLAQLNRMQTFFVAWSQSYCYNRNPEYSIAKAERLRAMPEESLVNGILSTMPEFAQTFNCPSGSKMAMKPGGCDGLFYK